MLVPPLLTMSIHELHLDRPPEWSTVAAAPVINFDNSVRLVELDYPTLSVARRHTQLYLNAYVNRRASQNGVLSRLGIRWGYDLLTSA